MTTQVLHVTVAKPSGAYAAALSPRPTYVQSAAGHLRTLAQQLGVDADELDGVAATRHAVVDAIAASARALAGQPSLFVLAFTGHGQRITDDGDDELDGKDEAWCLDDEPLIDDELMDRLDAFDPTTHVVLISNCCYAAGISDPDPDHPHRRLSLDRMLTRQRAGWLARVAALPRAARYARLPDEPPGPARNPAPNRATLAVCQARRKLLPPSESKFTATILDTVFPKYWYRLRRTEPRASYRELAAELRGIGSKAQMPSVTTPDLDRLAFTPG